MVHIFTQRERTQTELESVILPCLKITTDTLFGGKKLLT